MNSNVTPETVNRLKEIVGKENVLVKEQEMKDYSHDETVLGVPIMHMPNAVVKPGNSEELSKILKLANKKLIPVTPRGAGTGLSGGAVPILGGIVLSLERLNKIIEIDEDNLMITVEAGVPMEKIFEKLEKRDYFFPPHAGEESAHIGAVVATNAGGVRTIKYGVTRHFVKGAEFVLPTGEILQLGGKLLKNNTGYNLLELFIGSEGTLGIFTKVTLRFLPKPKELMMALLEYKDVKNAIVTVPKLLKISDIPLGLEYVERESIELSEKVIGEKWPVKGEAFLMVVIVGNSKDELYSICEDIRKVGKKNGALKIFLVDDKEEQELIMRIRSNMYEGLKPDMVGMFDIAVPPSMIAEFVEKVRETSLKNKIKIIVYGHAGDGNVHVHIMKEGMDKGLKKKFERIKNEVFQIGSDLGGKITGEHGVGSIKVYDLHYSLSQKEIELMKNIKKVFDPNNILNAGKVLPK